MAIATSGRAIQRSTSKYPPVPVVGTHNGEKEVVVRRCDPHNKGKSTPGEVAYHPP